MPHTGCPLGVSYNASPVPLIPILVSDDTYRGVFAAPRLVLFAANNSLPAGKSFLRIYGESINFPHFMEPGGSLPHSQSPASCTSADPVHSSSCLPIQLLEYPYYCFPLFAYIFQVASCLGVSAQKLCMHLSFSHTCRMYRPSHSSRYDPSNIWCGVQIRKLIGV